MVPYPSWQDLSEKNGIHKLLARNFTWKKQSYQANLIPVLLWWHIMVVCGFRYLSRRHVKCLPVLLSATACHSLVGLTKGRKGQRDHCGLWADWRTHAVCSTHALI